MNSSFVLKRNASEKIYIEFQAIWCPPTTMKLILVEVKGESELVDELNCCFEMWDLRSTLKLRNSKRKRSDDRRRWINSWTKVRNDWMMFSNWKRNDENSIRVAIETPRLNRTFGYFCRFPNRGNCKMHWDEADRPNATALRLSFR